VRRHRLRPMRDKLSVVLTGRQEPNANAMPATSPPRQIGQARVVFAVGPLLGNRAAAETKTGVPRVVERPAAAPLGEREDFFGGGGASVGEGGCLGAPRRQGGLVRRRLGAQRSGRLSFGAAVGPRDSSLLDLVNRHRSHGHEAAHKGDGVGDAAITMLPASDASFADVEQPSDAALRQAERAERRAKFGRSR